MGAFVVIDKKLAELHDHGTLASTIVFIVFHTLAGIALLGISIWMYFDTTAYLAGDHSDKFFVSIYILMAAGSLMTLVGFLGCCGAMQESSCMLATFSTFVLLIFAAEVAGAVYAYSHQDEVKAVFSKRLTNMVKNEYGVQNAVTKAVDAMQKKLKCCGASNPQDWADSMFNKNLKKQVFGQIYTFAYRVPLSCCTLDSEDACKAAVSLPALTTALNGVYPEGCIEQLQKKVESHLYTIIAVGIGIAVVQVFGFVFSLILCCAVSSKPY